MVPRLGAHMSVAGGLPRVGLEPFRRIVNDQRFRGLPMLLETPKAEGNTRGAIDVDPLDRANLDALRGLIGRRAL